MKLVPAGLSASIVVARTLGSVALAADLLLSAVPGQVWPVLAVEDPPEFLGKWGHPGDAGLGELLWPHGVTVDNSGIVYVADTHNHRIQAFDGTEWHHFAGASGSGVDQFNQPYGMAFDEDGYLYVADAFNNRVKKLNSEGATVAIIGSGATLSAPQGVAVDSAGYVYVADTSNNRIQKFAWVTNAYVLDSTLPAPSVLEPGNLNSPFGITVHQGCLYVVDRGNNRVLTFDGSEWTLFAEDSSFNSPHGIAVDNNGNVYITEWGVHQVQKFDSDGIFLCAWGGFGSGDSQFDSPSDVAIAPDGSIYVVETYNFRIQQFAFLEPPPVFLGKWGTRGSGEDQLSFPRGVVTSVDGTVYVADTSNQRIQSYVHDPSIGEYVLEDSWGGPEWGPGDEQFTGPRGMALDTEGNLYVADYYNHRIQILSSDGTFIDRWGSEGAGDVEFYLPYGIAIDNTGSIYVSEQGNNRVQRLNSDGTFFDMWGEFGEDPGQFREPRHIALDPTGTILYVVDSSNHRIQKFEDGVWTVFAGTTGSSGAGNGQFSQPNGIAVDTEGNVYVADTRNDRIQKFDSAGNFLAKWGIEGSSNGDLDDPFDITIDSDGHIFVVDYRNHRIQVFGYYPATEIQLDAGWNMVSFPVENPISVSPSSVFSSNEHIYAWELNGTKYDEPVGIRGGRGYWVRSATGHTLTIYGVPVASDRWETSVYQGWNLIGAPDTAAPLSDLAAYDCLLLDHVYWWEPTGKEYLHLESEDYLEPGKAYWIASTEECTITLPAP